MFPLPETITYWRPTTNDGYGRRGWSAPVTASARIAKSQKRFTDTNGDDQMSTALCYTEAPLEIGDLVAFEESEAASPTAGANDVRALSETPSATALRKAWFA